jgi:hypothetical protein
LPTIFVTCLNFGKYGSELNAKYLEKYIIDIYISMSSDSEVHESKLQSEINTMSNKLSADLVHLPTTNISISELNQMSNILDSVSNLTIKLTLISQYQYDSIKKLNNEITKLKGNHGGRSRRKTKK